MTICRHLFDWWSLLDGSGITGRGGQGQSAPQRLLTGKFLLRTFAFFVLFCFVFFFCFSLLKMTEICFGSTKMGIFYREKAFHAGKKISKNDFAPSEKYACYAPAGRWAPQLATVYVAGKTIMKLLGRPCIMKLLARAKVGLVHMLL